MRKQDLISARVYAAARTPDITGDIVILVSTDLVHRQLPSRLDGGGWGQLRAAKPGEKQGQQRASDWGQTLLSEVGYLAVKFTDGAEQAALLGGVDDNGQPTNLDASRIMGEALVWAASVAGANNDAFVGPHYSATPRFSLVILPSRELRPLRAHRAEQVAAEEARQARYAANQHRTLELTAMREECDRILSGLALDLTDREDEEIHAEHRVIPVPVETLRKVLLMAQAFDLIDPNARIITPS